MTKLDLQQQTMNPTIHKSESFYLGAGNSPFITTGQIAPAGCVGGIVIALVEPLCKLSPRNNITAIHYMSIGFCH